MPPTFGLRSKIGGAVGGGLLDERREGLAPHVRGSGVCGGDDLLLLLALAALPAAMLARPLASIQAGDIRDHLLAELRGGKKPSTVARSKTTLSALFTYAAEQGLLNQPHPVRSMKKIPELSITEPSVGLSEIPTPERVPAMLRALRTRRSDVADVFEFMSLTGVRWGELRAIRVGWLVEVPLPQLAVERSHSDRYAEKAPKSWRGTRLVPLPRRAFDNFRTHASAKSPEDYLFTNQQGGQLSVGVVRKFPLGFRRRELRPRPGTPGRHPERSEPRTLARHEAGQAENA